MCRSTQSPTFSHLAAASRTRLAGAQADPEARVGDADRDRASSLLADAAAEGYLNLAELDGRLEATFGARTRAELAAVLSDIPRHVVDQRDRRNNADQMRTVARAGFRGHLTSYLLVMGLLVTIWLVVGLAAGAWYPWPIWPALGWGIGIVSHARTALGWTAQPTHGWLWHHLGDPVEFVLATGPTIPTRSLKGGRSAQPELVRPLAVDRASLVMVCELRARPLRSRVGSSTRPESS